MIVSSKFFLEKSIQIIAILSPLIIGLGIISSYYYYYWFHIDILQYVELSEAILLFFQYAVAVLIIFMITSFIALSEALPFHSYESVSIGWVSRVRVFMRQRWIFGFIKYFLYTLVFCVALWPIQFPISEGYLISITLFRMLASFLCVHLFIKNFDTPVQISKILAIGILFNIFILHVWIDSSARSKYLHPEWADKVTLTFEGHKIISNSLDTIYVGKTSKYFYFYNKKKMEALIIKSENMIEMKIERNPKNDNF
jgi:hypothetical protein